MTKAKLIFVGAVVLALSAVGVVGFVATRPTPKPPTDREWLTEELNLTPAQRDKVKEIWTRTMQTVMQKIGEHRRSLRDERDAAIREMMSPEQLVEYDQIQADYAGALHELDRQKDAAFKEAAKETASLLGPDQAKKYEKILNDRSTHGGHGGHGPPGPPRHGSEGFDGQAPGHAGEPPPGALPTR